MSTSSYVSLPNKTLTSLSACFFISGACGSLWPGTNEGIQSHLEETAFEKKLCKLLIVHIHVRSEDSVLAESWRKLQSTFEVKI